MFKANSSCEHLKCRYVQQTLTSIEVNDPRIGEISTSRPRSMSSSSYCFSFLSSVELNKSDMKRMSDCTVIDLSGNSIEYLEENLFLNLSKLQVLILDNNLIKTLPVDTFRDLVNLRKLSMKSNQLEALPDSNIFINNKLLEFLDFSNNKLVKISSEILFPLRNLKVANFTGNQCINASHPEKSLSEISLDLCQNCDDRNIYAFIKKLFKLINIYRSDESDVEMLITNLFWLIVPIILILFAILAIISYTIFNKYFVYKINMAHRRS